MTAMGPATRFRERVMGVWVFCLDPEARTDGMAAQDGANGWDSRGVSVLMGACAGREIGGLHLEAAE
ncbi:hypothetical protein HAHE_06100 [Haloferula helveola]|uniref:Uncharacterized protein n=1 Tax=Haloferula helveola TaxID=490095 RepID=A0ABM7RG25_9BACT|nr:hypothetical protein HAHE_06100 [Haloferula helveola]